MNLSKVIYQGPNRDGAPIVVLGVLGGNNKTSKTVVSLHIIPLEVFDAVQAAEDSIHARGKAYASCIKGAIESACGGCIFGKAESKARKAWGLKRCYAQANYQNQLQPAAAIGAVSGDLPAWGVFDADTWASLLMLAEFSGIRHVRSAVVGDLGMLPEAVAVAIIEGAEGFEWLGYTHQWFRSPWLKSTHQASTQGPWKAAEAARVKGWGVYHVTAESTESIAEGFDLCPAQVGKLTGVDVSCIGCPIPCDGGSGHATFAIDHGPGCNFKASKAAKAAEAGGLVQLRRRRG